MKQTEFYAYYTDYDVLIDGMREKLLEAIKRNPKADFSEANYRIEKLERLRLLFHTMYHYEMTRENESGKIMQERAKYISRIQQLEKENQELKLNLNL